MSFVKDLLLFFLFFVIVIKYILLYKEFFKQRKFFINTLSHDLRVSTIAQIRALEILEKIIVQNNDKDLVKDIIDSCKFSLEMINMLLNSYRSSRKEEVLSFEYFSLNEVISSISKKLVNIFNTKKLDLCLKTDKYINLKADKCEISKALTILVKAAALNSVKNGTIWVLTKKTLKSVEISVVYHGKILTEEERRRMFSESPRFSTVGFGIKLQLCKKIIEMHRGKIYVENFGNNKNAFTFTLPYEDKKNLAKMPSYSSI